MTDDVKIVASTEVISRKVTVKQQKDEMIGRGQTDRTSLTMYLCQAALL